MAVLHQHLRRRTRSTAQVARQHRPPGHTRRQRHQSTRDQAAVQEVLRVGQGGILHQIHLRDEHQRLSTRRTAEEPVPTEHQPTIQIQSHRRVRRRRGVQAAQLPVQAHGDQRQLPGVGRRHGRESAAAHVRVREHGAARERTRQLRPRRQRQPCAPQEHLRQSDRH